MCHGGGHGRSISPDDDLIASRNRLTENDRALVVADLRVGLAQLQADVRVGLAQTEALLQRLIAMEAENTRHQRFFSVMDIVMSYLDRTFRDEQQRIRSLLLSPVPA
ncbi:hypothetical protein M5689_013442 [Euphorbia peplus]|nr:hypothetical protein M5689_013442 [Euphorbia peplus]